MCSVTFYGTHFVQDYRDTVTRELGNGFAACQSRTDYMYACIAKQLSGDMDGMQ